MVSERVRRGTPGGYDPGVTGDSTGDHDSGGFRRVFHSGPLHEKTEREGDEEPSTIEYAGWVKSKVFVFL